MRKIPTLFQRDPDDRKFVTREPNPECQWVLDGEGVATRKYDGTCVKYDGQQWWARREVKPGKQPPPGFVPEQHDDTTGKTVGWEPAEQSAYAKCLAEAAQRESRTQANTYELCGPKINGNPEGFPHHVLVTHGAGWVSAPRSYDSLAAWLRDHDYEGIVWHHADGRMAKLKKRDIPNPEET